MVEYQAMNPATPSRYKSDPVFRKHVNELVKKRHKHRMETEPEYAKKHKAWMRDYQRKYYKAQYKRDPQHRGKMLAFGKFHRMFGELRGIMRGEQRPLIGCTLMELGRHLQSLWEDGMNWDNYGDKWTIDHEIPTGAFDLTDPAQVQKCWHYTNLKPMCRIKNIRKGGKRRQPEP